MAWEALPSAAIGAAIALSGTLLADVAPRPLRAQGVLQASRRAARPADRADQLVAHGRRPDEASRRRGARLVHRELPPVFRTPGVRWPAASRKDVDLCLLLTLSSSVYARFSWPGPGTNRSPCSRRNSGSASPVCGTGWPRPTPTRLVAVRAG